MICNIISVMEVLSYDNRVNETVYQYHIYAGCTSNIVQIKSYQLLTKKTRKQYNQIKK